MAGKIGDRFFENWKVAQKGRAREAVGDLAQLPGKVAGDIAHKVVEEPWFGRQVTDTVGGGKPNTIYSFKHDASTHYDMSIHTNNSVNDSKTFNAPVNYNGGYRAGEGKDVHGNGGTERPTSVPRPEASYERANREHQEQETGIEQPTRPSQDIHGNGGEKSEGRSFDSMVDERYGHRIDDRGQGHGQDRSQQQEQSIDR